ncbi:MAG: GtrA family protein [Oscillospiraceae bacterium]|nr:GtrA family protein [Oscillospiraceae bacterium]
MKSFIEKVKAQFFNRETLSYVIVGGISTVANWIATYILNNVFHWGYWLTSIVTFAVGMIFTFVANRKYTFRSDMPVKVLFPRFVLNVAVCFAVSYGLMQAALGWFFANVWAPPVSQDLLNTLTGIAANCLYIVLNYIGQKFFVFRTQKDA